MDTPDTNGTFEFSGTAVHRRGWSKPVHIHIDKPVVERRNEFACRVSCSIIDENVRSIRAETPVHAYALAFQFLRQVLSDFVLKTPAGDTFSLPRLPPCAGDRPPEDLPIERGFTLLVNAVDPEGELGEFAISIAAPSPSKTGYSTLVHYGRADHPAVTIRGNSVSETFGAAYEWLENRLSRDRITLLDRWNEPIELPGRQTPSR